MAKRVPHLVCRGGRYYFRKRVPDALVPLFGKEVSKALGDVSKAQAEVAARELSHQFAQQFLRELHRMGLAENPPVPAPVVRPAVLEEVTAIAQRSARELLVKDEEFRIDGTHTDGGQYWLGEMADLDREVSDALATGTMGPIKARLRADLDAHGLTLPQDRTETRRMMRLWSAEQARALKAIEARGRGEPVATPPPVEVALVAPPEGRKLRDAFEVWRTIAVRPAKTVKAFERHLEVFESMSGNPDLATLRRADAARFRDALQTWAVENKKTARTADNTLTSIKALANVARDREWIEGNPFERLAVTKGGKDSEGREPWTHEELVTLFAAPLFKAYELPAGDALANKAGGDAAYWVPLIAAYTGARPSEVCQLWVDDVSEGELEEEQRPLSQLLEYVRGGRLFGLRCRRSRSLAHGFLP